MKNKAGKKEKGAGGAKGSTSTTTKGSGVVKGKKTTLKKDRYSTYDDQFQWFLIPALIMLLLDFIILEKRGEIDDKISLFKS